MKRIIDLFLSLILLVALLPLYILIGMIVRLSMGKPILFIQQRPGLYERSFYLLKFRTMRKAYDKKGNALPDYQRLTSVGRFLRKYSLDELPQLFNVVKGDMSLVGPRPLLMEYLPLYTPDQRTRHEVRPGMTGLAQINGRNAITWEEKFELDQWYVKHQTLWLDFKIFILTIYKAIKKEGITQKNEATAKKFTGSSSSEIG